MSERASAGHKPILAVLEKKGDRVLWCACGRSKKQPFCDGSHIGTKFRPIPHVAKRDREEALLCVCKQTLTPPFCDGSHNNLSDEYMRANEDEIENAAPVPITEPDHGDSARARLDGGCFVVTPEISQAQPINGWRVLALIDARAGAENLSQYFLRATPDAQPIRFDASEAVLFVIAGKGEIFIGGEKITLTSECAVTINKSEAFVVKPHGGRFVDVIATICPPCPEPVCKPQSLAPPISQPPTHIDRRLGRADEGKRNEMGDRFYQVLSDETAHGQITQFIGEIPKSRARAHRHLYEETLFIISGEGYMWTQNARARVKAGDVIYLPRKQIHSLECTNKEGMRLAGAFYPAGSPAINY